MHRVLLVCVLAATVSLGTGCAGKEKAETAEKPITADYVLSNMSPELDYRADTHDEARIRHSRTIDVNGRTLWGDVENILMLDRPSRLSLYPTP